MFLRILYYKITKNKETIGRGKINSMNGCHLFPIWTLDK